MNLIIREYLAIREDFESTLQEANEHGVRRFELISAYARQFLNRVWSMTQLRVLVALVLMAALRLPTFLDNAALFALITVYLALPADRLNLVFSSIQVSMLILLVTKTSLSEVFRSSSMPWNLSPSNTFFMAFLGITASLFLAFVGMKVFLVSSSLPTQLNLAIISFYLISLTAFVVSLSSRDEFILGWLSYCVLISGVLTFFLIGSRDFNRVNIRTQD